MFQELINEFMTKDQNDEITHFSHENNMVLLSSNNKTLFYFDL